MLSESQQALDVELVFRRLAQLHLGEGELLTQLVALPLVSLPINRSFVKERVLDPIEALSLLGYSRPRLDLSRRASACLAFHTSRTIALNSRM